MCSNNITHIHIKNILLLVCFFFFFFWREYHSYLYYCCKVDMITWAACFFLCVALQIGLIMVTIIILFRIFLHQPKPESIKTKRHGLYQLPWVETELTHGLRHLPWVETELTNFYLITRFKFKVENVMCWVFMHVNVVTFP